MSLLPAPQQFIRGVPKHESYTDYSVLGDGAICFNPDCGHLAQEEHHVVRRSHIQAFPEKNWVLLYGRLVKNKVPVCRECHAVLEGNRQWIEYVPEAGRYYWRNRLPDDMPETGLTEEGEVLGESNAADPDEPKPFSSGSVSPGEKCESCGRRVPHPPKKDSPPSVTISFRVPTDQKESLMSSWEEQAEWMGILGDRYWRVEWWDIAREIIGSLQQDTVRAVVNEYRGRAETP